MPLVIQIGIIILLCAIAFALVWIVLNPQSFKRPIADLEKQIVVNITNPTQTQPQVIYQPIPFANMQGQVLVEPQKSDFELEQEAEQKISRIIAPDFSKKVEKNFKSLGDKKTIKQDLSGTIDALRNSGDWGC